ncbi:hypothetical protein PsWM33_01701 [Pseudovibrio sp. WM33]|nr:hypothetical protein PsWM33_01701 [Pseudovibrio sp. WM33]
MTSIHKDFNAGNSLSELAGIVYDWGEGRG